MLAKYGIRMDLAALNDESRTLDQRPPAAQSKIQQRLKHAEAGGRRDRLIWRNLSAGTSWRRQLARP